MKLTVIQAFGGYDVGASITEQTAIDAILSSEHVSYVVQAQDEPQPDAPDAPKPDAKPAKAAKSDQP